MQKQSLPGRTTTWAQSRLQHELPNVKGAKRAVHGCVTRSRGGLMRDAATPVLESDHDRASVSTVKKRFAAGLKAEPKSEAKKGEAGSGAGASW
jgi:hypothetical protein